MGCMQLDLFEYAQEIRHARQARPQAAWEEPGVTLWGRAWLENVMSVCLPKFSSDIALGQRLLQGGRLTSCRVRRGHVQATFTNREGGTALVNLAVRPLPPARWAELDALCEQCGDALFTHDDLPGAVEDGLFAPGALLPELGDLRFECSHCQAPFCVYRAATLLAVAADFDRAPIKLFELRGAGQTTLLARSFQQAQPDEDDEIRFDDLGALFGIELEDGSEKRAFGP